MGKAFHSLLQELKSPNTNRMYFEALLTTQEYQITNTRRHKYLAFKSTYPQEPGKCY